MASTTDLHAFASALADGSPVVDVREPDEYADAHVPGARLIPMGQLPDRAGEIDPATRTYLICKSGGRSLRAAEYLTGRGFDVVSVDGGTDGWVAQGHPYATGPEPGVAH